MSQKDVNTITTMQDIQPQLCSLLQCILSPCSSYISDGTDLMQCTSINQLLETNTGGSVYKDCNRLALGVLLTKAGPHFPAALYLACTELLQQRLLNRHSQLEDTNSEHIVSSVLESIAQSIGLQQEVASDKIRSETKSALDLRIENIHAEDMAVVLAATEQLLEAAEHFGFDIYGVVPSYKPLLNGHAIKQVSCYRCYS
jgi:hypothetical protein